jgi:hypothetical protein
MKKLFVLSLVFVALTGFAPALKTSLHVTVRDEAGNLVPDANIKLYSNRENWEKETSHFAEGFTDAKGIYKFQDIAQLSVFLLVKKDDKDNTGGGEQTTLEKAKINKITVIIQ